MFIQEGTLTNIKDIAAGTNNTRGMVARVRSWESTKVLDVCFNFTRARARATKALSDQGA